MYLSEFIRSAVSCLLVILGSISYCFAQYSSVTLSGLVRDKSDRSAISYVNVSLKERGSEEVLIATLSNEQGRYTLPDVKPGNYVLVMASIGYVGHQEQIYAGSLSEYLELPPVDLVTSATEIADVAITARRNGVSSNLERKSYSMADNISQAGGSVLQSMQNLPGVSVQDGRVYLRGSDQITVLIDGKQTALTGFGSQVGLDNIPASAIEKVEIINNPSAKFDANGNAGIINIVMKKEQQQGFNGKVGITAGAGSLWERRANLPTIRPQYTITPKINPSVSLNYRKENLNVFLQADNLYTETLNKNDYVRRVYDDGTVINSQLKRNRNTNFLTTKAGVDWEINPNNTLTISGMFGSEKIIDRGDQPFFNADFSERRRLWQFLEDELKTTVMATASYRHTFSEPGHQLMAGFNYTFHREDEQYFYDNFLPTSTGTDAFKLLSDEQVYDFNLDYVRPLRYGRLETGIKLRNRIIPTNMEFRPGINSVLDFDAGGWADYKEFIPAIYGTYVFESPKWEAELGLRVEYVRIQYDVNPDHNTYNSDGYHYTQPFPNLRLAYKLNDHNKISLFYNRRVDRPNEVDIRIFPKYDDAEIIKVGNPALRPQFTNSIELGHRTAWNGGSLYSALYHRFADGTITRIASTVPGSTLIYDVFQNAGRSYNTDVEMTWDQQLSAMYSFNINANLYRNQINAFTVENLYPERNIFSAPQQTAVSGNVKLNNKFRFRGGWEGLLTGIYLAPDLLPQGTIGARFSVDAGLKKSIQKGKGELFFNATDLFNTMVIRREIFGAGFSYTSEDYYETQVVRVGYSYKF
ncbi:TonB-dependent receptor [Sphingobacterium sp. lm-10]|uniref:TonB-dependent receptor domain-containing protein n=1 Tax=Sphingobacterium sp. lm-10 TaxID=2944904 RepID=UPI0020223D05|nr:TonB-dependent receptor [Sphingobacterium sp. lm-10]MCL7989068.1 TonB-dependent receptor [Sphingobacterium sp. lm-10]